MSDGDIYSKSQRGVEELTQRKKKLSSRVRTMLILVDGTVPVLVLKEEAQKVGANTDFLEQLKALGLIVRTGNIVAKAALSPQEHSTAPTVDQFTRFRSAQDFMNVSVVNSLGIKSFFFTLRLERASTLAELRELVEPYKAAITKGSGPGEAQVLTERLVNMLVS